MSQRGPAIVGVGAVVGVGASLALGIPSIDAGILLVVAFAAAAIAHAGAGLALRALGDRRSLSVRARAVVVALVPIVSVVVGALAAARAMFVSSHDLGALVVVVIGAGTAGVLAALSVAAEIERQRRQLDEARDRERHLDRSRRELVAWVSHDLRTPLAGIRAMTEALKDGFVDDAETVARYYATITREVDRLANLVDDLFELSRIQAEALQTVLQAVPLAEVVSGAVAFASAMADAKGVRLAGTLHEPPEVMASTPELSRVVRNLLENAIRHTPAGGAVTVEVRGDADHAILSVLDQCGGIPPQDIDRVFDLAYRGNPARTLEPGDGAGGGLGLAIVRGLVEAHAGDVDVRNEADGCRFTVRLPHAAPRDTTPDPAVAASTDRAPWSGVVQRRRDP